MPTIVYDRHGHIVEDADVIPPGGRISVAPLFMDHLSEQTRHALQQLHDSGAARDGQGFVRGHRPGFADVEHGVYTAGEESPAAKARKAWLKRLGEAWRYPPPKLMPLHDRQPDNSKPRDGEAAWQAYINRTANAWRTAR